MTAGVRHWGLHTPARAPAVFLAPFFTVGRMVVGITIYRRRQEKPLFRHWNHTQGTA